MRGTMRLWSLLFAAILAVGVTGSAAAQTDQHGRISFADESGLIKGAQDTDWSYAALNSLVMPGDTIWADDSGALEMEFTGGTFVRLADGSRLDVLDVPPNGLFRGVIGSFYVQRVNRSNGDVFFETPLGTLTIEPDSQVRIDILEGGATTVSVRWGRALLLPTGESQSVPVNAGMRSYIDPGYLPSEPISFDRNEEDSFDTWNRERGRYLAQGSASAPVPVEYSSNAPVGMSELGSQGEWVYVDDTQYWRPTVVVNYVPYRHGYWSYVPSHGYVWCGNYPFSYVTSHYGHWRYHHHHGWIWRYAGHYRPAYAYTVSYGDYFVWAPLGYDGYPVHSSAFASFSLGNVHFSYGFSSFAYHYDVFHCRPRVFAVHHHHIFDKHNHHRYHNTNYWRIESDERPYLGAGRPHWPGDTPRRYQPESVYRGITLASDSGRRAPERARLLESRRAERTGVPVRPGARLERPTPVERSERTATVRQARVETPSVARIARSADPAERGADAVRSRTYGNSEARDALPLSRGSRTERPSDPTDRRSIDIAPNGRVEGRPSRPAVSERDRSRGETQERVTRPESPARPDAPSRPSTVRPEINRELPTRPSTIDRVERPGVASTRPQVVRPDSATTRPDSPRPTIRTRPEPVRPQTVEPRRTDSPRPSIESRPDTRPQRPETPSVVTRPQVERRQVRSQPSEPARIQAPSRPQVVRPERPSVVPETTRRQVTSSPAPSVSRREAPEPQRPSVVRSAPSPRVQAESNRSSVPSRRMESPAPRPQSPRISAPQPSRAPSTPSYSPPARQSSPQISAPSRSQGPSRSISSGGSSSRSSRGGGPQRSPR